MPLTREQQDAIEQEAEIAEVIRDEEEMELGKVVIPWMPRDGEATEQREEGYEEDNPCIREGDLTDGAVRESRTVSRPICFTERSE